MSTDLLRLINAMKKGPGVSLLPAPVFYRY